MNENESAFKHYVCQDCFTSFSSMNTTNCIYCGGSRLEEGVGNPAQKISLIPFAYSLNDAYKEFKKRFRNPLVPFCFHSSKAKSLIKKLYVPCTLYNFVVEGNVNFLGMDKISNVQGAPGQTFESLFNTHFEFKNLLMSHYSRLSDEVLSNVNDYQFYATDGTASIIEDAALVDGDIDTKKTFAVVQQKLLNHCLNTVRSSVSHERKKLNKNDMKVNVTGKSEIYVPIYLLNMKYEGKENLFIMNGQTGEILGDPPISVGSIVVFSLLVFLVIFGVACLIATLI